MANVDKSALLAKRFGQEDFEIEGVGTVTIRALTRGQALEVQGKEMPVATMEQKLLSWALVDPEMSERDIATWQQNSSAGELEPLIAAIIRLSGMEKAAGKAAYTQFRG